MYLHIPIMLETANNVEHKVDFVVHIHEPKMNSAVWKFCAENGVMLNACQSFFGVVMKSLHKIWSTRENTLLEHQDIVDKFRSGEKVTDPRPPQNVHYESYIGKDRHDEAFRNEVEQVKVLYKDVLNLNILNAIEEDANDLEKNWRILYAMLQNRRSLFNETEAIVPFKRVCFIHSTSFYFENNNILAELLDEVVSSGLIDELQALWVINHGEPIPDSLKAQYPYHDVIFWIEYSRSTSRFELQLMHRVVHVLAHDYPSVDIQVLYLHTKGVSYISDKPSIRDWRKMMTYFMVTRHRTCEHLLASGVVDTIGVNFQYMLFPHYWGNFYWASASYLTTLPVIAHGSSKYYAENWLLSNPRARPYCLHHQAKHFPDTVNYTENLYPPSFYVRDKIEDAYQPSLHLVVEEDKEETIRLTTRHEVYVPISTSPDAKEE